MYELRARWHLPRWVLSSFSQTAELSCLQALLLLVAGTDPEGMPRMEWKEGLWN